MEKLIIDNFLGGLSPSRYLGEKNQFDGTENESAGWDVFDLDDQTNVLRRGKVRTAITNSNVINGNITWMENAVVGGNQYVYAFEEGFTPYRLHRINVSNDTLVNSSPWPWSLQTITGSAQTGMGIYTDGTTRYLYYANGRYLGRYDLSLTFDNSYYTFLGSTVNSNYIYHPMATGNGKLFIGNSNFSMNVASIATVVGAVVTPNALDLGKTAQQVTSLAFDRNYLYIGTSSGDETATLNVPASLYLWDTVSGSWQEQYTFPEPSITSIKATGSDIFCAGRKGMYRFTGSKFELVYNINGGPDPWSIDDSPSGILYFGDGTRSMYAYGSRNGLPPIVYRPYKSTSSNFDTVKVITESKLYISDGGGLAAFGGSGSASNYVAATVRTPMFSFPGLARLVKVRLYFFSFPSGETLDIGWAKDDGSSVTAIGTISTTGATEWEFQPDGLVADQWQLVISHPSAGINTPKIRKIEIDYNLEKV